MSDTELEICIYSVESCLIADKAGADRIELCSSPSDGGITPSYAAISLSRSLFSRQLYVMIRPRGGDFCYSDTEFSIMEQDIITARDAGADGVVFGILNPNGTVDVERTKYLVNISAPMKVTFHRAFDITPDPYKALEDIISAGCHRILTSGQQDTALSGKELIKALVVKSSGRIDIMAGGGVNPENAVELKDTGVNAIHSTAKLILPGPMTYKKQGVSMGSPVLDEYSRWTSDYGLIGMLKSRIISGYNN